MGCGLPLRKKPLAETPTKTCSTLVVVSESLKPRFRPAARRSSQLSSTVSPLRRLRLTVRVNALTSTASRARLFIPRLVYAHRPGVEGGRSVTRMLASHLHTKSEIREPQMKLILSSILALAIAGSPLLAAPCRTHPPTRQQRARPTPGSPAARTR